MSTEQEERERLKQGIFSQMSRKRQAHIMKKGYEHWDPFIEPKDPIDIRKDKTHRTSQMLVREFLQSQQGASYGNAYAQGVLDLCLGIINEDERYVGMYEFAVWYKALLERENPSSAS